MNFWQRLVKKDDMPDAKPLAWAVHSDAHERAQIVDILERNGYKVKQFTNFDEACTAYDKLATQKKGRKPVREPELITTDLYGSGRSARNELPQLVKKIENKGIGHMILSRAVLDPDAVLYYNFKDYMKSGIPQMMQKSPLDEEEFMSKAQAAIVAAKEQQQKVTGRIHEAGEDTGHAI